jgi:chromosome segregation protein
MLIALELAGFKSFADKTRFDFPDGITVVVGPNGSGKSNVVDAIKWVLGAQSPKALRGQEMADVIFKGSSGSGRKAANSAEATLVFDNSSKLLPLEADEVQVTRRVYRSGESEYLINGQDARLKDIKNLFRGSGVGVDAYSLIEQGKVDRMLQASPQDRRIIFEEAAGISRFNAKKAEAEKRLLRVDQNLVRLKDIVDEVHTRLSTLGNQASQAKRYREMSNRLHEIRLNLGWTEYCESLDRERSLEQKLAQLAEQQQNQHTEMEEARRLAVSAEKDLHRVVDQCQVAETALQDTLQRIAVAQNQQQSLNQRVQETSEEWQRQSKRLVSLMHRAETTQSELQAVQQDFDLAQSDHRTAVEHANAMQAQVRALQTQIADHNSQLELLRTTQVDLSSRLAEKNAEIVQLRGKLEELDTAIGQTESELSLHRMTEQETRLLADRVAVRLKELHTQYQSCSEQLATVKQKFEENRSLLSKSQEEAAVLQGRMEGAHERLAILEELQQHLEGVDAGARSILNWKATQSDPVYQSVYGLVADLLRVDVNFAPLIDTALGTAANALVLRDGQLIEMARRGQLQVPGRLTLMRLDRLPAARFGEKVQLESVDGVIGRADRMVRCSREVLPLVRYLLGTTWLVDSLDVALELGHFRGAGLRFVTADCQLIESDGTITLGSLTTSSGLVSRGSEIRSARDEIENTKLSFQKYQGEIERLQGRIRVLQPELEQLERTNQELAREFAHQQASAQNAAGKLDEMEQRVVEQGTRLDDLRHRRTQIQPMIEQSQADVEALTGQIDSVEGQLQSSEEVLRELQSQLSTTSESQVAAQIGFARTEQRLEAATTVLQQYQRNYEEKKHAVEEVQHELHRLETRRRQAELDILNLTSQLADDHLRAESEEGQLDELAAQAKDLRERKSRATRQLEAINRLLDRTSQQIESDSAESSRCREAAKSLLQRYEEEYQIDLNSLRQAERIQDPQQLAELTAEATKLRQKINSIGEINMAALAELDELQQRYDHLNGQYQDLLAAKESLQRIIHKINGDSRRLFLETLEAIRQNFQKLYRKSFGGGHADILLEEGVDVLECGIDIVATPPGKTAFSNSLLSGGEKALTAVALLLAIFQYRPSPFCVLDEVDAPFDEANIGRFVNVLTEFLDWTKFIIVTHSKKTMTAANTLYGVTMQESGVSKRVAVRFEDVNEKGEILTRPNSGRKAA